MARDLKKVKVIFFVLFLLNTIAWLVVYGLSKLSLFEVSFFDVGQGDVIFIETPKGIQILIDGGPDPVIVEKLSQEMPFWDRTIDLIILTHPEKDHLAGLIEVLKRYKIENILWTGIVRETAEYKEWLQLVNEEGARVFIAKAGQIIFCSQSNPESCYIKIIYPFEDLEGKEVKDTNNTSIVAQLVLGNTSFLFTGDIYKSAEKEILEKRVSIKSDVLKVSHHGSKTSSNEDFVVEVLPKAAVISAGRDNRYGHPHFEVLETLNRYGIKVLRTDEIGDIKIISDGKALRMANSP